MKGNEHECSTLENGTRPSQHSNASGVALQDSGNRIGSALAKRCRCKNACGSDSCSRSCRPSLRASHPVRLAVSLLAASLTLWPALAQCQSKAVPATLTGLSVYSMIISNGIEQRGPLLATWTNDSSRVGPLAPPPAQTAPVGGQPVTQAPLWRVTCNKCGRTFTTGAVFDTVTTVRAIKAGTIQTHSMSCRCTLCGAALNWREDRTLKAVKAVKVKG